MFKTTWKWCSNKEKVFIFWEIFHFKNEKKEFGSYHQNFNYDAFRIIKHGSRTSWDFSTKKRCKIFLKVWLLKHANSLKKNQYFRKKSQNDQNLHSIINDVCTFQNYKDFCSISWFIKIRIKFIYIFWESNKKLNKSPSTFY